MKMQKTDKKLFRCKKTTITLLLILTAAALMFLTAEKTKAAEVTISFLYEDSFTGVDGDTSNWSTGDNTVNLGTNHWDLLSGTADVNGYINGDNHMLTHRGTRGLGVAGQENDEVDSHVRPEKIEITFDTPHQLRYLEVRSLFTNEGPNGEPEEGDMDLYLNETFVVNYHLVGVEDLHAPGSIGKVNVTVPNLCVDKIVYYVKQNQVYTPWSEFAVAKLILSVDNTPPNVYKEHPEHGYTPEEEEKTAVVPAPWQYWTTFVGGVTAIITWDPPQVNESVAIIREYATSQYEIPLDNLTWEDPMIQELDWILIDDEPVTIPPGGNVTFDISTTEDDTAVLIKYTVAWASTPYETQAHFINEALLETGSPQVIIGQLSNFDVHNFLNTSMDNFELELYGVETSDVVDWYYSHWVPMPQLIPMRWGDTWYGGWGNSPQIKPLTDGVEVKWKEFNHPAQPCEWVHFGLRLKPTVQPWGVKAYWTKIISPPYLRSCAPITLWAEDPMEDCLSGVEGIYYGFYYNDVWHPTDQQDEYCGNHNITTYKYGRWWYTYTNPIHFHEECIHKLHYWTRDNAGNQGPVYKQVYYVDDTPPTVTKTHPPDYQALNDTTGWIKVCSKITLEAVDEGTPPCIAGVEGIYWGFWFEDVWHPMDPTDTYDGNIVTIQKHGRWWYIYDEVKKIHWLEPGKHILEYWTKDNVCNQGLIHKQIYWANNCQPEVWVDKNYHSGTSGWWITHFNTIQDALNWLQPYGVAHINPGVYTENVSVDDVPWCDNTGVTIEGSTGCPPLPIGNSAVIDGTITIKVDDVTINNLVFQPNTDGAVIVEGNIGVTLNCNIFLQGCNVDSIGVNAYQGSEVEAEFNWWDAPNGPNGGLMDNGDTADGYGVQVIGNVHVEPWIGVHAEATASSHFVETGETIVFNGEGSWAANF
ncbi:MAG TPA: hypothetical protein EYP23_02130, partial [Thermoplasmata archaeon]|nr:hypothetical protein [Thermoplasmata archaeon]